MSKYAKGGVVSGSSSRDDLPVVITEGCMVAPAAMIHTYGRELLSRMNGGGEVLTVEEALAEMVESDGAE